MNKQKDIIYCVDVGVYEEHITLHKPYQVIERDITKQQTRIKGDNDRFVWIPDYCLNETLNPEFDLYLESDNWSKEDKQNLNEEFMSVNVSLPDGRCYSLNVSTYAYLKNEIDKTKAKDDLEKSFITPPDLLVEELSREIIHDVILKILRRKKSLDNVFGSVDFSLHFSDPWMDAYDLPSLGESLEDELYLEVDEGHPLFGKQVSAIAKRQDNDDALFSLADGKIALVHLTWSRKKEQGTFPRTQFFYSMKHFWEVVLKND